MSREHYAHPHSLRAHLLLVTVVFIWGSTFVLVKSALHDISPLLFNLLRMTIGFLCLAIIYRRHFRQMRLPVIAAGSLVGLVATGPLLLAVPLVAAVDSSTQACSTSGAQPVDTAAVAAQVKEILNGGSAGTVAVPRELDVAPRLRLARDTRAALTRIAHQAKAA